MDFPSTFNLLAQASELGCGFVLLGYVSRLLNLLGFALLFIFCLRILPLTQKPRFRSLPPPPHPNPKLQQQQQQQPLLENTNLNSKSNAKNDDGIVLSSEDENLEDEVVDVITLRKLVKIQRQRFNAANAEIDTERVAASSAAEEAMAMILRLQNEKSAVEIQANQFRRMVDERQEYDMEVIESLRWNVVQLESQKSFLDEQLEIYKEKLREFMRGDEIELRGFMKKDDEIEQDDEGGTVADDDYDGDGGDDKGTEVESDVVASDDDKGIEEESDVADDDKGTEEESDVAADEDDQGTEEESDVAAADGDGDNKGTEEEESDVAVAVAVAATADDKEIEEELSDVAAKEFCNFSVELDVEVDSLEEVVSLEDSHPN